MSRKENVRRYYKNHREEILEGQKLWHKNNPEYKKQWQRDKLKVDFRFGLNRRISGGIYKSLKCGKNGKRWENLVGYTLEDLIKQLKHTMPEGYTWHDFLEGKLHIDHKIPISAHNYTKPEHTDFKRCWALKNLRLLPAKENLIKSSKLDRPFQPSLAV